MGGIIAQQRMWIYSYSYIEKDETTNYRTDRSSSYSYTVSSVKRTIIQIMAYVLKQIGPIPSARDEEHRQRLQSSHGLSLLSSDGAYIPSFRSVWTKYWKNAVEESDGGAAYEDKNRGWFASLMAVASGEGGGDNVTKEVRLRYAKAHLAFVLASLKMRSKVSFLEVVS